MGIHTIVQSAEPFTLPGGATGCRLILGFTGRPHVIRLLREHLHPQRYSLLGVHLAGNSTETSEMFQIRWLEGSNHLLASIAKRLLVFNDPFEFIARYSMFPL